jgi:predicted alpha-1,6-mannanase (GH76 family)
VYLFSGSRPTDQRRQGSLVALRTLRPRLFLWIASVTLLTTVATVCGSSQDPAAAPMARLTPEQKTARGIQKLQSWYDQTTGLYQTTGWWNSANALTTLADYSRVTGSHQYDKVFPNTFSAAQITSAGFLNNYYDDEGWWALAWIDVYDLTGEMRYLQMSESIFDDMSDGWDATCSGGIWWSKDRKYKNAIANELFLSVAANLAIRAKENEQRARYLKWAKHEWQWFRKSGMIDQDHLVNDGLDAHCANNHGNTWTYNQGVILGGLTALSATDHDADLLRQAQLIAEATLSSRTLTDTKGILHDTCEPDCGADGSQFKGSFVRNLGLLYRVAPQKEFRTFIVANAEEIMNGMESPDYSIGVRWTAPQGVVNASTQSSGEDALVTALMVQGRPVLP